MFTDFNALINALANKSLLESCDDQEVAKVIKLLNKYGILGLDVIKFLAELITIIQSEEDTNDR